MMKSLFNYLTLAGIAILSSLSSTHAASLITNGSFEVPTVTPGTFSNFFNGSSAITGWTVFGPAVSIVSGSFGGGFFPAQDGIQWLDLTGPTSGPAEGVEQTVTTTPGQTYNLSFYVGTGFSTTSTVGVLINGSLLATKTNSTPGATLNWEGFTVPFTAASASTVIGFQNLDPLGDDSNGLDHISLAPTAAIPEPGTLSLLLVGTALTGLAYVRRRKATHST